MTCILLQIGWPDSRHIMAGLPVAHKLAPSCWSYMPKDRISLFLAHKVGKQATRWLKERWATHAIQGIGTCNYVATLTVLYADWLLFLEPQLAAEFLLNFPQFTFLYRVERLDTERQTLAAKIAARVARGGFDLSKHSANQHRSIAVHYCDLDRQLEQMTHRLADLKLAETLRTGWVQCFENFWCHQMNLPRIHWSAKRLGSVGPARHQSGSLQ